MNLTLAQKILRFTHPKSESERMILRFVLSKAMAEAEDLTLMLTACKPKKTNGSGSTE